MHLTISKSRLRYVLFFISIWILIGFNTGNADSSQYVAMFNAAKAGNFYYAERGFLYLCMIVGKMGFNYQVFLAVYSLIALLLISDFIKHNTDYPSLALLLYGIFPFLFDAVQIRNLMAEAIFLYALKYLKKFNVKNLLKYIGLILLASTQHTIALSYLVFLFVYFKDKKRIAFFSLSANCAVIVLYKTFLGQILMAITSNRLNYSFADTLTPLSTIIKYSLYYGACVVIGLFSCHRKMAVLRKNNKDSTNTESILETDFWSKVIIISICLIPFIIADGNYTRLFRNCLLIIYCKGLDRVNYYAYKDYFFVFVAVIAIAVLGCLMNFVPGIYYYDTVTYPIFHNNLVFEFFR